MNDGWRKTTLGDAAVIVMGQSPPGSSYNTEGRGLPFIQGSAEFGSHHPLPVKWCDDPRRVAQPTDLLVSVRAPVGDLNFATEQTAIGRGLAIIRGAVGCLTRFLALSLQHNLPELRSRSGGGMFESITRDGLSSLTILLPPVVVQQRTVDMMAAVDYVIDRSTAYEERISRSITAMSADLFGAATETRPLGEVVSIVARLVDPSRPEYGKMPYLDVEAMQKGTGTFRPLLSVQDAAPVSSKFHFTPDDVIYSKIRPELRKAAFPRFEGLCSADAYPLRAGPDLEPDYLFEALLSEVFARQAIARSGRTKMPKINRNELFSIEIPVPDRGSQREIAGVIGELRTSASTVSTNTLALVRLRSALLADLLSGHHEIPASYDELLSV